MRPSTRNALQLLAGCPDGATQDAMALHGVSVAELNRLVEAGHVVCRWQRAGTRLLRFDVARYWLTDSGRRALS
jgi:hypothetical protein